MSGIGKINCCSVNVRGLRNEKKRNVLMHWAEKKSFNAIFLQETFITENLSNLFENSLMHVGKAYQSLSNSSHSKGVAIILTNSFPDYSFIDKHIDQDGRIVLLNIELLHNNEIYTFINVYAPNDVQQRINFLKKINNFINQHAKSHKNIIICGDFNTCDNQNDRASLKFDQSSEHFRHLKISNNLTDSFKHKNPGKNLYTYVHSSQPGRNSRIDYILTSSSLVEFITSSDICTAPVPDHKAVHTTLDIAKNNRGRGLWKLNNAILDENDYKLLIHQLINETKSEYLGCISNQKLFDLIKLRVKEQTIRYCVKRSKILKSSNDYLEKTLEYLDGKLQCSSDVKFKIELQEKRNLIKNKLDKKYEDLTHAAFVRSRSKWLEQGERSTSYFLNLEKARQNHNRITKLIDANNERQYNSDKDILNHCASFYSNLYKSNNPKQDHIDNYLSELQQLPFLSEEDQAICEGKVNVLECEEALKSMKNNKSPGYDGLTVEFYKTFWHNLSDLMVNSFNESFDIGKLSELQNTSVLSLIHQKNERTCLKNYRPISLTNVDYRILAFALSMRLQKVIKKIISAEQTGYIKKRFIGTNIRAILDICENIEANNDAGILLLLDFEKAFDSVEWSFLFTTLKKFNFGKQFIQWIQILYSQPKAIIKNNGYLSNKIDITRGIRQGCPVSALLFILIIEILSHKIRYNTSLHGVVAKIGKNNLEYKSFQYADDISIFLKNDTDLQKIFEIISKFTEVAGPKLNRSKTEGIWLGQQKERQRNCNVAGIKWPTGPVRCLGIYIGNDKNECNKLNWDKKLENIKTKLASWQKRKLTLFGKVTIIKSLLMPQLLFPAQFLDIPPGYIKEVNKIFYRFVWNSHDRIKRNTLIADICEGGIQMMDIESQFEALKASWVVKLLNSIGSWSFLGNIYLNLLDNHNVLRLNFTDKRHFPLLKKLPPFYQDVITSFNKSKICPLPLSKPDLMQQVIWGNRHLTYWSKELKHKVTLYFKEWIHAGIIHVHDIKFINGKIDCNFIYEKVKNKRNIFHEISILSKVLAPFRCDINTHTPVSESSIIFPLYFLNENIVQIDDKKSKFFYKSLIKQKIEIPFRQTFWMKTLKSPDLNFNIIYTNKIKHIKDKKNCGVQL